MNHAPLIDDRNAEDRLADLLSDFRMRLDALQDEADRDFRFSHRWERERCREVALVVDEIHLLIGNGLDEADGLLKAIRREDV